MKRTLVVWSLLLSGGMALAGVIDADLEILLEQAAPDEPVSALVYLTAQVDAQALTAELDGQRATLRERHETVVRALQAKAADTQDKLLERLDANMRAGAVSFYEAFWVANIVRIEATPDVIREIAEREDVEIVYPNYEIELIEPVPSTGAGGTPPASRSVEPGVAAVRAPEVWNLGFTGEGVLVANMDTGVDGNHPALASRWAGLLPQYAGHPEWAWYDPYAGQNDFPYDNGGHGTHTMGSVCGGAPGDEIGVAPGAVWMASAPIDRGGGIPQTVADAILSFQWMVDPDGDPSTNWDVPAVCSNSWGVTESMGYPDCDQTFWSYIDNCEAAGIVILFSAGNEGTSGLRKPSDRATTPYNICAVAAVDANTGGWPIASFSSRGPTYCTPDGSMAIKPDIAAPGVSVRSAYPGGGYESLSGTSMASPHVNGVVALIRQANPDLSVDEVKEIIYQTAVDLGPSGEDNSYGWGMIDAYEAVQLALSTVSLTFEFPEGRPEFIDPNGGQVVRVVVNGQSVQPEPGSGLLHYSVGGSYTSVPMNEVEPNVYDAVFPAFECGVTVDYYFSVETTDGDLVVNPYNAPDNHYAGRAYTGITTFFEDDFETDLGWEVYAGADTGDWERANPQETEFGFWDPVIAQPEDDHTPNGSLCYVTGPLAGSSAGDYDVDGGPTRLMSPVLELADTDAVVSYWRWFHISTEWNDEFLVQVSNDNGASWVTVETLTDRVTWAYAEWTVSDYVTPTDQVRVRFIADDSPNDSLVEALVDDFEVWTLYCDIDPLTPGDMNCDGVVDFDDINAFVVALSGQAAYEAAYPDCYWMNADCNGDGLVNFDDIDPFVGLISG